jgi:AraC family transcriptional regulator
MTVEMPVSLGARRTLRREVPGFGVRWLDFAPALSLPTHAHARACIAVVLHGGFDGIWAGREGTASSGTLIVEPAGELHANRFFARSGAQVVAIQPVGELACGADQASRGARPDAVGVAWRMAVELSRPDDLTPIALEGLSLELLAIASRAGRAAEPLAGWLSRATEIVDEQYARPLALGVIAAEVGVHPIHLARSFRSRHGVSVGTYLRSVRVHRAADRLANSDEPIAEVALSVGFADQSHLNRWFVRLLGATPAAYRRQLRGLTPVEATD